MKQTADLQESLYQEFIGRVQQTDTNVPYRYGGWYYYSRTVEGKQYSIVRISTLLTNLVLQKEKIRR
jgi:oligopeptidase B